MTFLRNAMLLAVCAVAPVVAADPGLLQYVGPDARDIAGLNVDRAVASPLGAFLQQRTGADTNTDFQKFIEATGFDPRRDLREIVAVSTGTKGSGLVVARGVFNAQGLGASLQETYKGVDLYAARHGKGLIAFPESSVALYGDAASLKAALDRRGADSSGLEPALGDKVRDISSKYDLWFLAKGRPNMRFGQARLPNDALQLVSGGLTLGAVVQLNAEAQMRSERDAQSLVDTLKFVAGIAQLQQRRNPEMARLFSLIQNAQTRVDGSTVTFSTSAPEADIEQLLGGARKTASLR